MKTNTLSKAVAARNIIGDKVKNMFGEDLGTIEEVMIDVSSGQVAYLVLSFGGILGMGNKLFAIPWQAFSPHPEEHKVLCLNVDQQTLKAAPGFDKKHWPDTAINRYLVEVNRYYGYEPYWEIL